MKRYLNNYNLSSLINVFTKLYLIFKQEKQEVSNDQEDNDQEGGGNDQEQVHCDDNEEEGEEYEDCE